LSHAVVGSSHEMVEAEADEMGFKRFIRRVGTVAAAPVLIPTRAAKKKVERFAMKKILAALLRHALTAIGGAGFVVSDNEMETVVSAIMVIVGLAHSIYEKRTQPAPAK
jgi:hypothetical protein